MELPYYFEVSTDSRQVPVPKACELTLDYYSADENSNAKEKEEARGQEEKLRRWIDWMNWVVIIILAVGILLAAGVFIGSIRANNEQNKGVNHEQTTRGSAVATTTATSTNH